MTYEEFKTKVVSGGKKAFEVSKKVASTAKSVGKDAVEFVDKHPLAAAYILATLCGISDAKKASKNRYRSSYSNEYWDPETNVTYLINRKLTASDREAITRRLRRGDDISDILSELNLF